MKKITINTTTTGTTTETTPFQKRLLAMKLRDFPRSLSVTTKETVEMINPNGMYTTTHSKYLDISLIIS